mmetsp:Transcript_16948/g.29326  ORF Transcript_16948/g.29326 Transcript_16948/m.29326 type:complete len:138 (-) Transcript_16948:71-484(-)
MAKTCTIGDEIVEAFNKFKTAKTKETSAMILKINVKELKVEIQETFDDNADYEDIQDELPSSVPRYIIVSQKHVRDDGRITYPLLFIYYVPTAIKPELAMLYSSTKHELGVKISVNKTFEVRDADQLTEEWVLKKLK